MRLFGLIILFLGAGLFISCNDECDNVECENSSSCDEGICICQDGFEGTLCEIEVRTKFLGAFEGDMSSCFPSILGDVGNIISGATTLNAVVQLPTNSTDVSVVEIFAPNPILDIVIEADVTAAAFSVPATESTLANIPVIGDVNVLVSGTGTFTSPDLITLSLLGDFGIATQSCTVQLNRI